MDDHLRSGEHQLHHAERDRFTFNDGKWYFKNREQELKGPYDTMEHAQQGLDAYIYHLQAELDYEKTQDKWHQSH